MAYSLVNTSQCEHGECTTQTSGREDYCEEHYEHYFCECGTRLEDASGSPGDGFCKMCQ